MTSKTIARVYFIIWKLNTTCKPHVGCWLIVELSTHRLGVVKKLVLELCVCLGLSINGASIFIGFMKMVNGDVVLI